MRNNHIDGSLGRYKHAMLIALQDFVNEIVRDFRPHPWSYAREDARAVLRQYVAGILKEDQYPVSEDEALDKLGFAEASTDTRMAPP